MESSARPLSLQRREEIEVLISTPPEWWSQYLLAMVVDLLSSETFYREAAERWCKVVAETSPRDGDGDCIYCGIYFGHASDCRWSEARAAAKERE